MSRRRPKIIYSPRNDYRESAPAENYQTGPTHEVGSFPAFIGEEPPAEYQYDPRQTYDPENIGPAKPGYGEKGGNYLLIDEQDKTPNYIPSNSSGETRYPEGPEYGPPPPTFHATNIPETAQKWGKAGQDYTFLAESPGAMKTAKEIGAPRVMKGYQEPEPGPVGPEPKPGELDEMDQLKQLWGHYVNGKYQGRDPLKINPAEEGIKAEEAARSKYALELMNRDAGSDDYKAYEKLIADAKKDAEKKAEWERRMGQEDHKMALGFFKEKLKAEKPKKGPNPETRANVQAAQKYTEAALYGPNAWQNYDLTEEDLDKIAADKNYMPEGRKVKQRILIDVNRVRELAGLPPIAEEETTKNVPMVETRNFTPWGPRIPGTAKTKSTEARKGYSYAEGQRDAFGKQGGPQVVRTGTDRKTGRKVVMYSDGRVAYAPN